VALDAPREAERDHWGSEDGIYSSSGGRKKVGNQFDRVAERAAAATFAWDTEAEIDAFRQSVSDG